MNKRTHAVSYTHLGSETAARSIFRATGEKIGYGKVAKVVRAFEKVLFSRVIGLFFCGGEAGNELSSEAFLFLFSLGGFWFSLSFSSRAILLARREGFLRGAVTSFPAIPSFKEKTHAQATNTKVRNNTLDHHQ